PAGGLPDQYRVGPDGQAEPGELGELWPGDREPEPALVRRPPRPSRWDQGRSASLWRGVPAREPPGNGHAGWEQPDPRPGAARRDLTRPAAWGARSGWPAQRAPHRVARRRCRAARPDSGLRAGLPDAKRRTRR